jgi:hypothetical protein
MRAVTAPLLGASYAEPPRKLRVLEWLRIAHCLQGEQLPCGCVAGTYQTWSGIVLTIVDAPGPACPHADHREHWVIAERSTGVVDGDARRLR